MEAKPTETTVALTAFMAGLIDYAGLFPPAQLPLAQALANYGRYRQEADAWMLGRFIIPASRLGEGTALLPDVGAGEPPWPLAVLGGAGATMSEFEAHLEADLEEMGAFRRQHGPVATLDALEIRLPESVLGAEADGGPLTETIARVAGMAAATERPPALFFEPAVSPADTDGWQRRVTAVVGAIARHNQTVAGAGNVPPAGFKLRCGGVTASAFPSVEQVALVLLACREAAVPLKATAGLHHPLPRFDQSVQATMHGFLNLFGAGILAQAHDLDQATIAAILADAEPGHFIFQAHAFHWESGSTRLTATVPEIRAARQNALLSYGSCSFDEPRADLRNIRLLS
jgi:hypothetical protein